MYTPHTDHVSNKNLRLPARKSYKAATVCNVEWYRLHCPVYMMFGQIRAIIVHMLQNIFRQYSLPRATNSCSRVQKIKHSTPMIGCLYCMYRSHDTRARHNSTGSVLLKTVHCPSALQCYVLRVADTSHSSSDAISRWYFLPRAPTDVLKYREYV